MAGQVKELTQASYILSDAELDQGYILACQSVPRGDVKVTVDTQDAAAHKQVAGRVIAQAADAINLANYQVTGTYSPPIFSGASTSGLLSGLEGSAIIEISRTGQTIGNMAFNRAGTGATKNDTGGLIYLGNGQFVVTDERLQNNYKFSHSHSHSHSHSAGGTAALGSAPIVSFGPTIGSIGIEGISYDARNGNFVTVKQDDHVVRSCAHGPGFEHPHVAVRPEQPVGRGRAGCRRWPERHRRCREPADPEPDSRQLIEITRAGVIKSSFDLSNMLADLGLMGAVSRRQKRVIQA